ncbi:adenylate/guanylate cyclase domain-containing protein [Rhizobium leguminosarum]|uniref:adenylate/guanylate cyclase domain-containing protein n=1 Tax=Rhizobium TaxID=379 RepID=UPI001C9540A8|nr:adenylate/guanylate cyclase domain-containing protein [Rhizobium leguminosarum]MBY5392870.1 adenylate/guanylate cyclase domain-containing protein [Rhizobium leguminosarum]MBY5434462.1 adenylate/guanylate cyclase domain-containing protein [Rhizobium leguminosarum]
MTSQKRLSSLNFLFQNRTLEAAQRTGFILAVLGRTVAVTLLAFVFLWGYHYPVNIVIFAFTLFLASLGLVALISTRTRFEIYARYAFFCTDAVLVSLVLTFVPLSSGDSIPQNLVFLTSRVQYYYVVIAASILTLSPWLVVWTGASCVLGLTFSTAWIVHSMREMLSFSDLAPSPSREVFYNVVLNPNFIGLESRIEEGLIMTTLTGIAAVAVHRARSVASARLEAEERRRQIQRLFGKYVPSSVIGDLASDGQLAPQIRDATLLFADVEGFTALSENLDPSAVISLLNGLFSSVSTVVSSHGGLVVNYFGDAVIAAFNLPLACDDHELRAVRAAQEILQVLADTKFDGHRIKLRIGIASGPVAAGTVGSEDKLSFTLYGDTVNLSQRLEALNKKLGTNCLLCGRTFERLGGHIVGLRSFGEMAVRNRDKPVAIYALANAVPAHRG